MTREPLYTPPADPNATAKKLAAVAIALVVVGGFASLVDRVRNRPPEDLAVRFADVAPFVEFHALGAEGWAGRVDAGWAGLTDDIVAKAACDALLLRLAPTGGQTVLILGADGLPARECLR